MSTRIGFWLYAVDFRVGKINDGADEGRKHSAVVWLWREPVYIRAFAFMLGSIY